MARFPPRYLLPDDWRNCESERKIGRGLGNYKIGRGRNFDEKQCRRLRRNLIEKDAPDFQSGQDIYYDEQQENGEKCWSKVGGDENTASANIAAAMPSGKQWKEVTRAEAQVLQHWSQSIGG